jgi:hypothetical protein
MVAVCALAFPLVIYVGTIVFPDLVAIVLYWMLPAVLPLSYVFPETVFSATFLMFLSPTYYTVAVVAMFLAWYGLGYIVGRVAARHRRPVLAAALLLPSLSAVVLFAGYALAPAYAARLEAIGAT